MYNDNEETFLIGLGRLFQVFVTLEKTIVLPLRFLHSMSSACLV